MPYTAKKLCQNDKKPMSKRPKTDVITAEKQFSVDRGFSADPRKIVIFRHNRLQIHGTLRALYRSYIPLFLQKIVL